jgi:hypothetical protein
MKLKSLATAVVIAFSALGANATTTNLGAAVAGTPLSFNSGLVPVGSFDDYFTFTLPTNSGAGFSAITFDIPVLFSTTFTSASFFSNADGIKGNEDDTNVGTFTTSAKALSLAMAPVAAGAYYINIKGTSSGSFGGAYNGSISTTAVTAVPEPESYAMLLAGLGLMGVIARRRNKSKAG